MAGSWAAVSRLIGVCQGSRAYKDKIWLTAATLDATQQAPQTRLGDMENRNDNPMGPQYHFPLPQFMIPGPYTTPSQFYAHLGPAGCEGSVSDLPETPTPSPPVYELSDNNDDNVKADGGKCWPNPVHGHFFHFLLADMPEGAKCFKQHQTNPGHVYSQAMYGRTIDTFTWMRAFNDFTGNGGGNTNCNNPEAILKSKLKAARAGSQHLRSRSQRPLPNGRIVGGMNYSGVILEQARRLHTPSFKALPLPSLTSTTTVLSSTVLMLILTPCFVSEPKHVPSSSLRKQANILFSSMGDLVKIKMKSKENKVNALEKKLAIEQEKLDLEKVRVELDKTKGKVKMVWMLLEMNGVDDEVKGAANEFLKTLFS
ncbi:hypothetical protein DFH08DRAFT_821687 [Mycena albidolilacea]|uniref:Uncharacterized protein n=1 Tax=Mycena albidolilacea TaxID=1033008 RepID=A0AAD6ZAJ0_9AGAR|nr:hypothetical protein DFH08DRAFT_821687 [Mycena albidolilacea]